MSIRYYYIRRNDVLCKSNNDEYYYYETYYQEWLNIREQDISRDKIILNGKIISEEDALLWILEHEKDKGFWQLGMWNLRNITPFMGKLYENEYYTTQGRVN